MEQKKLLFLCEQGEKRSPTCASVAREFFGTNNYYEYGAYSRIRNRVSRVLPHINSFDFVFVVEYYMYVGLIKRGLDKEKVFCLNIADEYSRDSPELRDLVREKLEDLLKNKPDLFK